MAEAAPAKTSTWTWGQGALGSRTLTLENATPDEALRAVDKHATRFHRLWCDVRAGVAQFMAPARAHEGLSRGVNDLALALCAANGLAVVQLASSTIGPRGRSADPDESYFVGRQGGAVPGHRARGVSRRGRTDGGRAARLGGGVRTHAPGRPQARSVIHDLQAHGGPHVLATSRVLPGLRADRLPDAVAELPGSHLRRAAGIRKPRLAHVAPV